MAAIALLATALFVFMLSGCSLVKEGITGEKPAADPEDLADAGTPAAPAAFYIIGDWYGVYAGNEYLSLRFTADGKCELQPALYPSDMFGPRYYGDYHWGGDDGRDIILDLYQGVSHEVDYGEGNVWDEWSDGGRDSASTALSMTFHVYGGAVKSFALKAGSAGSDTEGYLVVQAGAFLVLLQGGPGSGNPSTFIFGSEPYDQTEGKKKTSTAPDSFLVNADRFYTTEELNVRCGPSTDFGTYGTIPKGTPVDKIGYMATGHDDWAFVLLEDGGGWVNTGYISANLPEPASPGTPADDDAE